MRVVTRIYATGEMDVSLHDASSRSGGADVGAAKPVNLLFPEVPRDSTNVAAAVRQNYTNGWNLLSDMLERATTNDATGKFLPGGSLRLAAASARSIMLKEEFNPPLILGYLGFDCMILDNGKLGSPIPTHAVIDPKAKLNHAKVEDFNWRLKAQIGAYQAIARAYTNAPAARQQQIRAYARKVKLTADSTGAEWVQNLGEIVDGSDASKTEHLMDLQKFVEKSNP